MICDKDLTQERPHLRQDGATHESGCRSPEHLHHILVHALQFVALVTQGRPDVYQLYDNNVVRRIYHAMTYGSLPKAPTPQQ